MRRKKHSLCWRSVVLWSALAAVSGTWVALGASRAALDRITAADFQAHVRYLASDRMQGRADGSRQLEQAADYIAGEFRRAGLEPLGGQGSYFQPFPVTIGAKLGRENSLEARLNGRNERLALNRSFVPFAFSAAARVTGSMVFAGYGITAEEYGYDDYKGLDVKDRIVIVLRHEPQENDEKSAFNGRILTTHSFLHNKAINARMHGARAIVIVNDRAAHPAEEDELVKFGQGGGPENLGIVAIQVKAAEVDRWLAPTGRKLADLEKKIDETLQPQSFALPESVSLMIETDIERVRGTIKNVVGYLPGSDPALNKQAIVLGAHYDHIGHGERSSLAPREVGKVHPGADDNASGTSALLELARAFAAGPRPLRSVIFVAFAGEELGLLGSSHYTKEPPWPLDQTIAMLNMDMVGRVRDSKLYIGGVGSSPVFKEVLEQANKEFGFKLEFSTTGYGASDHTSFYIRQIPVLFFFSGLHADYHKPSDRPEKIDSATGARVAQLVYTVADALDQRSERPAYAKVQEEAPTGGPGGGGGYGAYFGSIPDFGETENGVKFADIRDGSPAQKAGLKPGDVLVEFDSKAIKNLYDFTYALRSKKPGDEVDVVVLRNGQPLRAHVRLAQRK